MRKKLGINMIIQEIRSVQSDRKGSHLSRMEAIYGLDELPGLPTVRLPLLYGGSYGVVDVVCFEILKSLVASDVLQHGAEVLRALCCYVAQCGVGVHPAAARGDGQAVHIVINVGIGDVVAQ